MFDLVVGIVRGRSEEFCQEWEKKNSRGSQYQGAVPRRARTCRRVGERHIIGRNSGTFERRRRRQDRVVVQVCSFEASRICLATFLLYRSFFRNQGHSVGLNKNVLRNSCEFLLRWRLEGMRARQRRAPDADLAPDLARCYRLARSFITLAWNLPTQSH